MQKSTEWLTSSWSYCLFIALLAMVIMASVMFIPAGDGNISADSSMRFGQIGAAFSSLPIWVTRWMTFQHYVFAGSLLFFIWHVEARVYLFGLIVSHGIFMGMTLMPGLVEAHAHLTGPSSVEKFVPGMYLPPEELALTAARNARILLDYGFTSAYSAGALSKTLEISLNQHIVDGGLPG